MENNSEIANAKYEKKVNKILKTYNSIMVKCRNIPILPDKNIIIVDDINSMINTQIETRKPILYYQEENFLIYFRRYLFALVNNSND